MSAPSDPPHPRGSTRRIKPQNFPDRGRAQPTLTVVQGPAMGQTLALGTDRRNWVLGRAPETDLVVDDPSVSRRHALFYVRFLLGDTYVEVSDLGSTNGTWLNGVRTTTGRLKPGDKVAVGDVVLRYDLLDRIDLSYLDRLAERVRAAETDATTGLLTKHFYVRHLPDLVLEWNVEERPWAVIVLDVDAFKQINDEFGHLVGDQVLCRLASVLATEIRETDLAIRFGGDEFVLVLPGSDADGARLVAERIERAVGALTWRDEPGRPVSVSQGVSASAPGSAELGAVFKRADEALLEAKQSGRGRVCVRLAEPDRGQR